MNTINLEIQALEKIQNKYLLAILVAKRINQLKKRKKSAVDRDDLAALYEMALTEIVEGVVYPEQTRSKTDGIDSEAISGEFQIPVDDYMTDQEPIQGDIE